MIYKGVDRQKESVRETTELIKRMNEEQKGFALLGLLSFADKVIDDDVSADIRRILTMTKVGRMIAEEWDEKLRINTKEVTEQVTEQDISILVKFCKKMGGAVTDLVESLMQDYNLNEAEAQKKIEMYW